MGKTIKTYVKQHDRQKALSLLMKYLGLTNDFKTQYPALVFCAILEVYNRRMDMKQLRERVNLRTVDVASRLNIGESTVRAWEKGKSTPSFEVIKPLMDLYGVSFDLLHQAVMKSRQRQTLGDSCS